MKTFHAKHLLVLVTSLFVGQLYSQNITVTNGQTLTISVNTSYTTLTVNNGGTLIVNNGATLTVGPNAGTPDV